MSLLCNADATTFWAHYTWTDYAAATDKDSATVVIPVCGMADWGLGYPLDAEETLSLTVLKKAIETLDGKLPLRITPPLRFILGADKHSAFTVSIPTAHRALDEWCQSVKTSGYRKILFYNSSPWNEDLVDAAARDARIAYGLQMFCINLAGIGLDFHPGRGERSQLQLLLAHLYGTAPQFSEGSTTSEPYPLSLGDEGYQQQMPAGDLLSKAAVNGPALLQKAAAHLASLLEEVDARPPLPNDGIIGIKEGL